MPVRAEVRGINETRQTFENVAEAIQGREMVQTMYTALNILGNDAKRFAPVDTGRLRSSIKGDVSQISFPMKGVSGVVGSSIEYAGFQEEGTGTPAGNAPVKMPPIEALQGWARRHGVNARVVALAIFKRGGLEPRRYFARSLEKNERRIIQLFDGKVRMIIQRS